ncbi:hypothetical protein D3C73_1477890 [compost metagenome]
MGTATRESSGEDPRFSGRHHPGLYLFGLGTVGYVNLCPNRIYWILYREKDRPE